jgi:hypothetical protein
MEQDKWSLKKRHRELAEGAETLSKAAKLTAGFAVGGAWIAAPTGLTAVGVSLGLVSAPLVVTAAPVLTVVAGVAATLSAGASLYSKYRNSRSNQSDTKKNVDAS